MPFWKGKKKLAGNEKPPSTDTNIDLSSRDQNSLISNSSSEDISMEISSVPEAQLAIKQLKLRKKEFNVAKKQIAAEMKRIRTDYRLQTAQRGSMMRGGGKVGKLVRGVQRANRDAAKAQKENALAPLENEKLNIELMAAKIDSAILQIEQFIIENS